VERVIFVEVLDRRGRVHERAAVTQLPFRIGRGYDCDLILDDPHVDALHAVVERNTEGELQLRDAGSRNGIVRDGSRRAERSLPIADELGVRVGRTHLRLRTPAFAVGAPVTILERSAIMEWLLEHWSAAVVLPVLWVGLFSYDSLRATTIEFDWLENFTSAAWGLLALSAWIGTWALFNRLLRHRTRFIAHSTIAFVGAAITTTTKWGFEWLHFFIEAIDPVEIASLALSTLTGAAVLFAHLSVMAVGSRKLRLGFIGVGFATLFGLQTLDRSNEAENWASTLPYWSRLEPVDPRWLPLESPDAYFAGVQNLAEELDELALEAQEEDTEDEG